MRITNDQVKRIHVLLPEGIKRDKEQKANLMQQFTKDYRKTSTKDLTFIQANQLIKRLGGKPLQYDNYAYIDFKNKQHRYIYSLLMQHGWTVYSQEHTKSIADLQRLSDWLKSHRSPVKKKLKDMTPKELSKIITALEQMMLKALSDGK